MKIHILASGSKGNSTLIESNNTRILIDAGINNLRITNTLKKYNIDPYTLDGIIITHTHADHISGLASVVKKLDIPVVIKEDLKKEISKVISEDKLMIFDEDSFSIKGLDIETIKASHDVPTYGFIIGDGDKRVLYLTDTGYINRKYISATENLDAYIIESNHDEKMLMEGPYPYILKQRVISDKGHLSNRYTGQYLNKVIGDKTKCIVLAHISENNNTPELALQQVKEEIKDKYDKKIICAKQHEETEVIEI